LIRKATEGRSARPNERGINFAKPLYYHELATQLVLLFIRGFMNSELAEQLIALFKYVVDTTQENQLKLAALERSLNHHQAPNAQYNAWDGRMRFVPSARAGSQKIQEIVELLRQELLRDSAHCEACGRPEVFSRKQRSGNGRKRSLSGKTA